LKSSLPWAASSFLVIPSTLLFFLGVAYADNNVLATTQPPAPTTGVVTDATPRPVAHDIPVPLLPSKASARRRDGSITVDGKLEEDAWKKAVRNSGFTQRFPKEGAAPSVTTEFAVVYDDEALYVGVWSKDDPLLVRGLLTRRDQTSSSDRVNVAIDSYHDRRTAFVFGLNPASVQYDEIIFDDVSSDLSWDAVWSGAASVSADGWHAELRIPMSQLRFSSDEKQEWGLQITRTVARTGEEISWTPWPRSQPQIVSRFGLVDGIEKVKPGRRIELLPYVTAGVGSRPVEAGDPLNDGVTPEGNLGLDAKYGLSSSFSIAATINPDFGQVEADPSQVNLSANELFFPEKRPFFLDGVEMFKMGMGSTGNSETLFYTRRIGAAPHGDPDADYVEAPTSTTIYGATKISGKTRSGWSLGVLNAVTAEEDAAFVVGDGAEQQQVVEPLTNYTVAKLKRDLREGKTTISVAATAVNRALDGTGMADELHDQAYTGGLELQHRFWKERFQITSKLIGSYVHGSEAAIVETQERIRHLYQRPDAGHVHVDPTRTSLSGAGFYNDLTYRSEHFQAGVGTDLRTPGLELNDLGYQVNADHIDNWSWASYLDNDPGETFLNYRVNFNSWALSSQEPELMFYGGNVNGGGLLKNHWSVGGGLELNRNLWQASALRGGPALRRDNALATWWEVGSDARKAVSAGVEAVYSTTPASASYVGEVGFYAKVQAASNIEISAEPSFSVGENDAQYIDQVEDAMGQTRYLMGRIRQVSSSLTLRVSWTFSPRLSFQAYAQPFFATGKYESYKEVVNPRASSPADRFSVLQPSELSLRDDVFSVDRDGDGAAEYEFEKPDFGVRELRSTMVLRWEYRPGSSVFAIWSHNQDSSDYDGNFRLGRGISRLGKAEAEDIVMLKLNYWIGV
jgi:Domain of unknown function (DUF5916)/Carbohydrate family 9 binding domain-like